MPTASASPPIAGWNDVATDRVYDAPAAASLFGVSVATVNNWAKAGKLKAIPRMSPRQPFRFIGAELLRHLGDQAATLTAAGA